MKKIERYKKKLFGKFIKYNADECRGKARRKSNEVVFHKEDHNHTPNDVQKCI